jgi:flagellar FliL protein
MADQKDSPKEGKGKKKMFLIITIVVLVLAVGGGVAAWYFLRNKPTPEEPQNPGDKVPVPQLEQSAAIGPMVDIDEFIVNIISGDTAHYVKASLTVELTNENARTEVENRMPQMRDTILMLIGNKTYEELQDLQGKKQLKAELMSNINSFLQTGKVKSIYFTNFVVQ